MKRILFYAFVLLTLAESVKGETFLPQNLTPIGFNGARQPQATISSSGEVYVVFGKEKAIYLTTSTDHGQTFALPAKVADVPGLLLGMRRGPRIAVSNHRIVITVPAPSLESFISDDNGKTWSQPLEVSDKSGTSNEGLQNMTALPDGSFYAVWLDHRRAGAQVEGARLDAGAAAWSPNVDVYISPDNSVCECCHPSVASNPQGKLSVMWRNLVAGNRDFYLAESSDRGDTFSSGVKLGNGSWPLNACPMDGGGLVATADGVLTIWRRQRDVFTAQPGTAERRLAKGAQPVIGRIGGDWVAAYEDNGQIILRRGKDTASANISSGGFPSFAAAPNGKEGLLVWDHSVGDTVTPQFVILH